MTVGAIGAVGASPVAMTFAARQTPSVTPIQKTQPAQLADPSKPTQAPPGASRPGLGQLLNLVA